MYTRLKNACSNVSPYIFTRQNAPTITGALLLTGAGILSSIGTSYTFSQAVNALYTEETTSFLGIELSPYAMVVASGLAFAANNIIGSMRTYVLSPLGSRISQKITADHIDQIMKKNLHYHEITPFGSHNLRFNKCFMIGDAISTRVFSQIIPPALDICLAVGYLCKYGPEIGAGLAGVVSLYIIHNLTIRNAMVKLQEETQVKMFEAYNTAVQEIKKYKTVHDFNNMNVSVQRMTKTLDDAMIKNIEAMRIIPKAGNVQALFAGTGYITLCLLAARHILNKELPPSDFTFIATLISQFITPLSELANALNQVISSIPDVEILFDKFRLIPETPDPYPTKKLNVTPATAKIDFQNVHFHIQKQPILNGINCTIEAGEKIGIVGGTGAGKSTMLNLLFRHYMTTAGAILINGQNINSVGLSHLRSHIGIVPQMPVLFNDTLYNNIAYGGLSHGEVTKEMVEAAIDAACLRTFVNSHPQGVNTLVGEGGAKVSGGERQRIAIARVILKNPSIVILDEATSALDNETERDIQANLDTVFKGKTQLVIAHRLSTIMNSHNIFVLQQGQIVESGNHVELLAKNGVYTRLYNNQFNRIPPVQVTPVTVENDKEQSASEQQYESSGLDIVLHANSIYSNCSSPRRQQLTLFSQSADNLQNHVIEEVHYANQLNEVSASKVV